jgi:hypothetical protein
MAPTPHNDLHPTARDHTQKEGREESHCDLRVEHCDDLQEEKLDGAQLRDGKKPYRGRRENLAGAQFGDFERRDPLGAGRSRCR